MPINGWNYQFYLSTTTKLFHFNQVLQEQLVNILNNTKLAVICNHFDQISHKLVYFRTSYQHSVMYMNSCISAVYADTYVQKWSIVCTLTKHWKYLTSRMINISCLIYTNEDRMRGIFFKSLKGIAPNICTMQEQAIFQLQICKMSIKMIPNTNSFWKTLRK